MFVNGSELYEQSLLRTFQGCFLPSFESFGQSVSEEKIFQKSTNKKQELPVVAMFVNGSGQNDHSLQRTFHRCFLPNFSSFGKVVSEEKIFQKSTNQKQEWPVVAMFVNGSELNEQSLQRTFQDASYQVLIHLARRFQRRFFRNQSIRNKNGLWRPCLLTDRDEMSNHYRGLPQMLPIKFRFIWPSGLKRRRLKKNRPIRNKNCLWRPCLLMDRDKISNLYRGPSIDATYQISFHLRVVSEQEIFLEINQSKTRMVCGGHVCKWIGTK